MITKKKFEIGMLALTMLLIGVVFAASASTNNSEITNSDNMQIPDFGPYVFDDLKEKPNFLLAKGQIPNYTTQAEKQNWIDKLDKTRVSLG